MWNRCSAPPALFAGRPSMMVLNEAVVLLLVSLILVDKSWNPATNIVASLPFHSFDLLQFCSFDISEQHFVHWDE